MPLRSPFTPPRVAAALALALVAGCATRAPTVPLEDGDLALPADYRTWPVFMAAVQRPDIKQVREIYVNPIGYDTRRGYAYGDGAMFVMENWAAKVGPDGEPVKGADGKLVKDRLAKVFLMQKGPGFATKVPADLRVGTWVFGSYDAKGVKIAETFVACRGCHIPMSAQDYVWRHDEHFAARR